MRRAHERGSMVSFIIIGVLLAAMAAGGVYALNRYNASHSASRTPAASDTTQTTEPKIATPSSETTTNVSSDQPATNASTSQPSDQPETNKLPQTGPADIVVLLVMAGTLVAGAIAYVRSRRDLVSL